MLIAVFKIAMQYYIPLLGGMVFVFYQFERPPVFFNQAVWERQVERGSGEKLRALEADFNAAHAEKQQQLQAWLSARRAHDANAENTARTAALAAQARSDAARAETRDVLRAADPRNTANDSDYVFITFILGYLPHGLIGLLIAVFFAATFSYKAGELNALGSTTTVDLYRHVIRREASDRHYVIASKCFTAFWGLVAIAFALFANLAENLIQATNIVGSIFYGVMLGLFLVAFFLKRIGGTAAFWAAIAAQMLVFVMYATSSISYLWYNVIGCFACVLFSAAIQLFVPRPTHTV